MASSRAILIFTRSRHSNPRPSTGQALRVYSANYSLGALRIFSSWLVNRAAIAQYIVSAQQDSVPCLRRSQNDKNYSG